MSGIAGCLAPEGPIERQWLNRASSLMSHTPRYHAAYRREGGLAVAYASPDPERDILDVATHEHASAFFAGNMYSGLGDGAGSGALNRAQAVLERYLAGGMAALRGLNGAFVLGVWDARSRELHLMTDRFGLRKLYYATVEGTVLFASEVKALLAHPGVRREVDALALAQFLSFGHLLDDRTLYPSVRLLQGGWGLTYAADDGAARVAPYWMPRYATAGSRLTLAECADELAGRLDTAVDRQIRGAALIGIPLSGGLDSRTVLGFTRRYRSPEAIRAFSMGHGHTYDVVFGRRLARVAGAPHRFVQLEPDFLARRAGRLAWLTDGMVNAYHCWQLVALEHGGGPWDHLLLGYLGGPLTAYHSNISAAIKAGVTAQAMEEVFLRTFTNVFVEEELRTLLRPSVYEAVRGLAPEGMRRTFRSACVDEMADRTRVTMFLHDQQRCIWYLFATYCTGGPVSAPFTANAVMDFLLTVPVRYRADRGILKEMLRRHLPRLARVASDKGGLALDTTPGRYRSHRRWRRLVTEQLPRWTGGRYRWHDRRLYAHYDEWMRRPPMPAYLREKFQRSSHHLAEWCEPAQVQRLLEEQLAGQANRHRQISALLTLALWFEQADAISTGTGR